MTGLAWLLLQSSLWATEPPSWWPAGNRAGVVTVASHLTLDEIRDRELVEGGGARSLGTWAPTAMLPATASWRVHVRRVTPAVWRLREPAESFELPQVSLELLAPDGTPGRLLHESGGEGASEIRVSARPLPPTVVERDTETFVVQGGAELRLDLSNARTAGRYSGTLVVTLHHF